MFLPFQSFFSAGNAPEVIILPQPSVSMLTSSQQQFTTHQPKFFVKRKVATSSNIDEPQSSDDDDDTVFEVIEILNSPTNNIDNTNAQQEGINQQEVQQINRRELFRVPKQRTEERIPSHISHNLFVDWETELVNQMLPLVQEKKIVRAVCDFCCEIKRSLNSWQEIGPCLIRDWRFENITTDNFQIYSTTEDMNFKYAGFIDGKLIRHKYFNGTADVFIEDDGEDGMKQLELEEWNSSSAITTPLPCENVSVRVWSLNALVGNNLIYLYETNENKFKKTELKDRTLLSDFIISPNTITHRVIIKEGNRLRVFLLIEACLYELRWSSDHGGELQVVDHLVWLRKDISAVVRVGNSLLVSTISSGPPHQTFIYNPSPFDCDIKEGTLSSTLLPENVSVFNLIWNDETNCLIDTVSLIKGGISGSGINGSVVLTQSTISKLEVKPTIEFYSEEALLNNYKFKNYTPPKITDALEVKPSDDTTFRGSVYYLCKHDRYNDMEIIAGINCSGNEKLKFALSPNYLELKPENVADYIGAPVMYLTFGQYFNLGYIFDMMGKKRDSKYVTLKSHFFTSSFDLYDQNSSNNTTFMAILSPREDTNQVSIKKNEGNKEWEELAQKKQFRVESDSIRVSDYSTRGYVEIGSVESGLWSYNQKIENDLPAQLIAFNEDYRDNVNPSIENDWNVPEETFAVRLENSYHVCEKTTQTRPLNSDGWQVSVCGISVDGGQVGIFDASHHNDDNVFDYEIRGFDIQFQAPSSGGLSAWSSKLQQMFDRQQQQQQLQLQQQQHGELHPLLMNVPFGIISGDAETGDGHYACLSKVHKGKVVAVKVIIQHPAYP